MQGRRERVRAWTRGGFLRGALGAGALVAGGAAIGSHGGLGTSGAAPSERQDAEILEMFLLLERVQEAFYRAAVTGGKLTGELLEFAEVVGAQETEHVGWLTEALGGGGGERPRTDFRAVVGREEAFREAAIELEEATIGVYIGQGGNLTRDRVGEVARMVSVEARQAAWIRDVAGVNPAPRAADPARTSSDVLAGLRRRGYLR